MLEVEERVARFSNGYREAFPASIKYQVGTMGEFVKAGSSAKFCNSRFDLMRLLLEGNPKLTDMTEALALERLVNIALEEDMESAGFTIGLTPQTLECSEPGRKGLDLVICDSTNMAYLGIDVKLRIGESPRERDGYGWNQHLRTPYIYLSLGNFTVDTRERDDIVVREWLREYAIPKIRTTGKIPQLSVFKAYLARRIERSLYGYVERLREPEEYHKDFGLPPDPEAMQILQEKLAIMDALFCEMMMENP